ncbi:cyanophycinase [Maricaulis sp.]|uniref:cyanophycinase n=1 Tax=Maricaulis sp. TaxID=1486257 RepID=UPI001B22982E|nr:cyanophycinase [Maricaulis sp.]MBO6798622.1 cyanophycinase [Maricaulis sp.]
MFRTLIRAAFAAALLGLPASAQAQGRLVIVGGGLQDDNAQVYGAFLEAVNTRAEARIAVIVGASGSPATSGGRMAEVFAAHGFDADLVDLVRLAVMDDRDTPADESRWDRGAWSDEQIAVIEAADAIWFTGGDQMRLTRLLLQDDGTDTPMLTAIRQRHAQGATLGGTSAGAAIMSARMIQRGDTLTTLVEPVLDAHASEDEMESGRLSLGQGLGFFPLGLVDQHFEERARLGRLARALVETGAAQGFGIDEDTALVVDPASSAFWIAGAGGVSWVDASDAHSGETSGRFGVEGLRVSYLSAGDRVDWDAGRVSIPDYKSATVGNEYFRTPVASGGGMALPPAGLPEVAGEGLVDNSASSAVERVSFAADGRAVIYRFSQTADSQGYWGRDSEGEARYSILRVGLDILPAHVAVSVISSEQGQAND